MRNNTIKRHNSNTIFRGHSILNGLIKDLLAYFQSAQWTQEDQFKKDKIFKDIIIDGKCWYCGIEDIRDMDHFMPTNGRLFDPPMFGLEHEGNIIPSCNNTHKYAIVIEDEHCISNILQHFGYTCTRHNHCAVNTGATNNIAKQIKNIGKHSKSIASHNKNIANRNKM